jgi:hypothetical protein
MVSKAIEEAVSGFDPQIGDGGTARSPVSTIYVFRQRFEWREGKYHSEIL